MTGYVSINMVSNYMYYFDTYYNSTFKLLIWFKLRVLYVHFYHLIIILFTYLIFIIRIMLYISHGERLFVIVSYEKCYFI